MRGKTLIHRLGGWAIDLVLLFAIVVLSLRRPRSRAWFSEP